MHEQYEFDILPYPNQSIPYRTPARANILHSISQNFYRTYSIDNLPWSNPSIAYRTLARGVLLDVDAEGRLEGRQWRHLN